MDGSKDFTVAGTVPDLNRIPFYTNRRMRSYHQIKGKVKMFIYICTK